MKVNVKFVIWPKQMYYISVAQITSIILYFLQAKMCAF